MRSQDGDVKLGVLPLSVGVEITPRSGDFPRNLLRRTPGGSLEEKMFDEMRDAVDGGRLKTRSRAHPEVHGDRGRSGVFDQNDAQPVGKGILRNPSLSSSGKQKTEEKKEKNRTVTSKHFFNS